MTEYAIDIDANRFVSTINKSLYENPNAALDEMVQNAQRAEADRIEVTIRDDVIEVVDDGIGCDNPQSVLTLSQSGWSDDKAEREGAFGLGFWSVVLFEGEVIVRSHDWRMHIDVPTLLDEATIEGVVDVSRPAEQWVDGFEVHIIEGDWDPLSLRNYVRDMVRFIEPEVFLKGCTSRAQQLNTGCSYTDIRPDDLDTYGEVDPDLAQVIETETMKGVLAPAKSRFAGAIQTHYQDRPVESLKSCLPYLKGDIRFKTDTVRVRAPDRKAIIKNDQFDDRIEELREIARNLFRPMLEGEYGDIDTYDNAILHYFEVDDLTELIRFELLDDFDEDDLTELLNEHEDGDDSTDEQGDPTSSSDPTNDDPDGTSSEEINDDTPTSNSSSSDDNSSNDSGNGANSDGPDDAHNQDSNGKDDSDEGGSLNQDEASTLMDAAEQGSVQQDDPLDENDVDNGSSQKAESSNDSGESEDTISSETSSEPTGQRADAIEFVFWVDQENVGEYQSAIGLAHYHNLPFTVCRNSVEKSVAQQLDHFYHVGLLTDASNIDTEVVTPHDQSTKVGKRRQQLLDDIASFAGVGSITIGQLQTVHRVDIQGGLELSRPAKSKGVAAWTRGASNILIEEHLVMEASRRADLIAPRSPDQDWRRCDARFVLLLTETLAHEIAHIRANAGDGTQRHAEATQRWMTKINAYVAKQL